MTRLCPNRLNLFGFSVVIFGLALSVFAWGLQYKVSLYDPPQSVSHTIPEAKLLSEDQQVAVAKGVTLADTKLPAERILFSGMFCLFLLAPLPVIFLAERRAEQDRRRPWSTSCAASMNAFFFRPPPVLL
jgi:hypothetical protein